MAGLGLGTIVQAEPFQCTVSVKVLTFVPLMVVKLPTAQMSFAAPAETAVSVLPVNVLPAGGAGSGAGTTVQAEPSQCSTRARPVSPRPTAQAFPPPRFATPNRADLEPPVVNGVGTMVQLVPSQCDARGSVCLKDVRPIDPT